MLFYRLLADALVVLHFAYVAFVVVAMLLILLGILRRWRWVRNFYFRVVHFLMIGAVAAESVCGIECPLTRWEYQLRGGAGQAAESGSFVARWMHRLLFFDAPDWAFSLSYCLFAVAVLAALVLASPNRPARIRAGKSR